MDTAVLPPLLDMLLDHGLLIESGVDGLYGRSGAFEEVVARVEATARAAFADKGAEIVRFPPGMARADFERSGYMRNFPQLPGIVRCFCGDEREHRALLRTCDAGEDWARDLGPADVVLTPAACYPVYPMLARRGTVPADGWLMDVASFCFRHEPSREPTRMQWFRQQEFVRVGTAEQVSAARESWLQGAPVIAEMLGLPHSIELANDPFFGRVGRLTVEGQREQQMKFELLVPVNTGASSTACVSFNHHGDRFGQAWGLRLTDGSHAHTACIGFGLERLAIALFRHHGPHTAAWPAAVREALWTPPR